MSSLISCSKCGKSFVKSGNQCPYCGATLGVFNGLFIGNTGQDISSINKEIHSKKMKIGMRLDDKSQTVIVSGEANISIPYNKLSKIQIQNEEHFSLLRTGGALLAGGIVGAALVGSAKDFYMIITYNDDFGKSINSVFKMDDTSLLYKELMSRIPARQPLSEILKLRWSEGEITTEQYESIRKILKC